MPAIYGLQQLKKQRFSPGAIHRGKMDKPAAAGPLKAKFFLGGFQTPAAAPSKAPSAGTTRSKAAWITRGVTPAIGPKKDLLPMCLSLMDSCLCEREQLKR